VYPRVGSCCAIACITSPDVFVRFAESVLTPTPPESGHSYLLKVNDFAQHFSILAKARGKYSHWVPFLEAK
jgi:hypothetical protein